MVRFTRVRCTEPGHKQEAALRAGPVGGQASAGVSVWSASSPGPAGDTAPRAAARLGGDRLEHCLLVLAAGRSAPGMPGRPHLVPQLLGREIPMPGGTSAGFGRSAHRSQVVGTSRMAEATLAAARQGLCPGLLVTTPKSGVRSAGWSQCISSHIRPLRGTLPVAGDIPGEHGAHRPSVDVALPAEVGPTGCWLPAALMAGGESPGCDHLPDADGGDHAESGKPWAAFFALRCARQLVM